MNWAKTTNMMKVYGYIIFGALIALAQAEITEEDGILVITSENFQEAIDKHKFIMVEFYAPWCGHCKALAPEYVHAAEILNDEKSEIKLAKCDATENQDLARTWGVGGYPTLKYFRSGQPLPFKGQRTADAIVEWVKKKSGPSAKPLSSVDEAKKFVEEGEVSIIGFFKEQDGFKAKNFFQAAEELDEFGYTFGITSEADVMASYEIEGDAILVFKPFDDKPSEFKGKPYGVEDIKNFIISSSLPTLVEFDPKYASRVFHESNKKGALWLIISSTSDEFADQKKAAEKIAEKYEGKVLTVILDFAEETSQRFISMLGAEADAQKGPVMRFAYGWGTKYSAASEVEMTEDGMEQFLQDQFASRNTQITWSKTEEIPEDWDKAPVKVLVGKSLANVVKANKNVFVEFYAPWCGHCKALTPTWDELGEKVKGRDDIMIAKLEATANSVDRVQVRSFPTLILFKGTVSNQIKYDKGDRSLEALTGWLEEKGIKMTEQKDKKDEL